MAHTSLRTRSLEQKNKHVHQSEFVDIIPTAPQGIKYYIGIKISLVGAFPLRSVCVLFINMHKGL